MSGHRLTLPLCSLLAVCFAATMAQQPAPAPVTAPPALTTPAPPTAPLTVDEAVAFALRANPAVVGAAQSVRIAEAQVDVARAGGRPSVNVVSSTTYNPAPGSVTIPGSGGNPDRTISLGDTLGSSINISGTQPVWPATSWRAPVAAAQAAVGVNATTLTRTRQQIAFQVRQAYFSLLSAQQLQQVAADAVTVAQTQLRLAQTTFEAGTAPKLDVLQATAGLEAARVNLLRAENATDLARATLAVQLGLPSSAPLTLAPPTTLPAPPSDIEPLVQAAIAQRPELEQINFRRQQLRASIDLIRLQQQPLASASVNYGKSLIGSGGLMGGDSLTASLNIALAAYNGGRTQAELRAAELQLEQLDTTARQIELGITLDVRQAALNLQSALAQLIAARRQLDAANQALEIAQLRYQYGEGILLEVEQARLAQTQARTALAQAQFQANLARAQLDFAVGTPEAAPTPAPAAPATPAAGQPARP